MKSGKPVFFAKAADLRKWLQQNHATADDLWVGMYKKHTGKPSVTWPELVDQVLCFGWIDGIRKSIDDESYMIRITPRRNGSIWSRINIIRANELIEAGLMQPAGAKVFAERDPRKTERYSFEQTDVTFAPAQLKAFKKNKLAWRYFQAQPVSYRRPATWWVISARQAATQERRLAQLIADSAAGQRIAPLRPTPRKNAR